jgi:hypothetical protein
MKSKSQKIRDALASGDRIAALRIAAHFHDRSASTLTYKCGLDALNHPDFYRQIGKDPQQMTATAVLLLQANFIQWLGRMGDGGYGEETVDGHSSWGCLDQHPGSR